jgi:hypothetical protein
VDEFKIFITGTPLGGRSLRRAPGTPGFDAIAQWLDYDHHYRVDPYAEAGLWDPEDNPHLGRLCWTAKEARLLASHDDEHIRIRLARPDMPGVPDAEAEVQTPWGTYTARIGKGDWEDNYFEFPSNYDMIGQPCSIELRVSPTFVPLRYGVGLDGRELGVMLSLEGVSPYPNLFRPETIRKAGSSLREGC